MILHERERGNGKLQQEKGVGRCVIGGEGRGDFSMRERGGMANFSRRRGSAVA